MYCPNCGHWNEEGNLFCAECGAALDEAAAEAVPTGAGEAAVEAVPTGAGEAVAEAVPAGAGEGKKRQRLVIGAVGAAVIAVLGVLLVVALVIIFVVAPRLRARDRIMVAYPARNDESDLYLLNLGQEVDRGVMLVDEEEEPYLVYVLAVDRETYGYHFAADRMGTFAPGSNYMLYWYLDGDDAVVYYLRSPRATPTELIKTDALPLAIFTFEGSDHIFLRENREGTERCYFSDRGAEAERVVSGDSCFYVGDGEIAYALEFESDATVVTFSDTDQELELEEVSSDIRLSYDADYLAYTREDGGETTLYTLERRNEEETSVYSAFDIVEFGFLNDSHVVYYVAENEEGELALRLSDREDILAEGYSIGLEVDAAGEHLVYMVEDDDGEDTVYAYTVRGGNTREVLNGDDLAFTIANTTGKIFIHDFDTDDGDYVLYSADIDGHGVVELINIDDVYDESLLYDATGTGELFVILDMDDGETLYYVSPRATEAIALLDEWYRITVRASNEDWLVFGGIEDSGDDPVLYSLRLEKDASPIELDDDGDDFYNAIITPNGRHVVYTAETGNDVDDLSIRQVRLSGNDEYEELYDEGFLVAAQWGFVDAPLTRLYWPSLLSGSSMCPGAASLAVDGTVNGEIDDEEGVCYRFYAPESDTYTFDVDAGDSWESDFILTIYDREGTQVGYNDDGPTGPDPRLTLNLEESALYFLMVTSYGDTGDYSLTAIQGISDPAFRNASAIRSGQRIESAITGSDELYIETYDYETYGHIYVFQASAGDYVIVDVIADSVGSDMDPHVFLFDGQLDFLDSDDDSGDGYDSHLEYDISTAGTYYILVHDLGDDYGSSDSFFYYLELEIR
ncbi:MAG: zinc ribbon domain-containing protein [Anaerolineae bacterium]|nr:zinc ribbon domain-containing protein [Anaerolineae bacterium]